MEVIEVKNKSNFKKFLKLPQSIYSENSPNYIAPLLAHTKMMLGPLKETEKHLLLVKNEDQPIARLAFKVHRQAGEKCLHFGFFETHKDFPQAAKMLFDKASQMYPELVLRGPYHFLMEDPYIGTLVEGFDLDPYIFMPYNHPYYDEYLKKSGLNKAIDLLTYEFDVVRPKQIQKIAERSARRGYSIRWIDPKNIRGEVVKIAAIFNESLAQNWGFEPITEDQLDEMYMVFKYFIDPRVVCFVQHKDEKGDQKDIGCLIMLPNLNHFIKPSKGKLNLSLIWNLLTQRRNYDKIRGYALAVSPKHQGSGIVCHLVDAMFERGLELNIKKCEISWVLEDNFAMAQLSKSIGGKHNKTYRVYEKAALQ